MQFTIKYFQLLRLLIVIVLFACIPPVHTDAQIRKSPSSAKVSEFSDAQIDKVIDEMDKRNLSMSQAKALARSRGASEKQIADMEEKILKAKSGNSKTPGTNSKYLQDDTEDEVVDERSIRDLEKEIEQDSITAEEAKIFGHSLFNNKKLSFEPNVNSPVSDSYVLGPGDVVIIDVFGLSHQNYTEEVGRSGSIDVPLVGPIFLAGQTLASARQIVMSRLKSIYSDLGGKTSLSVNIGKLRTINVSVLGEVTAPGTYTVSGATSLFNVLYLSGGPNRFGSFRDVQLLRDGKVISHLDVYDFIVKGNSAVNVALRDGDIVMVPTYQKRVTVEGAFKRVGYFEAKEGETTDDIISYAGGFAPDAYEDNVQYTRNSIKGKEYKSIKVGDAVPIMNGDVLTVATINEKRINNQVVIEGAVFAPGPYEYKPGLMLSTLVKQAGGITENAFLNRGVISRFNEDRSLKALNFNVADLVNGKYDTNVYDGDSIYISTQEKMRQSRTIQVTGHVCNPITFEYRDNITLGDAIVLAGGLEEKATPNRVEIFRTLTSAERDTVETDANGVVKTVTITKDLAIGAKENDFILQPYDVITVLPYPSSKDRGMVQVSGEVAFPGQYSIASSDETLLSVIRRVGGFTKSADIDGARLYRQIRLDDKMKEILERNNKSMEGEENVDIEIMTEDHYELVAIDLGDIIKNPNKYAEFHIRANDEIVIPERQETVSVTGQVLNAVSLTYAEGLSAKDYVELAGGFSPISYKSKLFVIHPSGKAVATKHFLWFKKYPKVTPGSQVVVPEKVKREHIGAAAIVSMSSSVVAMLAIVVNLIRVK